VLEPERLAGVIAGYEFEPMRLLLADSKAGRCYYTTDWLCRLPGMDERGRFLRCDEVKGYWREAARVRIKVAADRYPWIHFRAVTKKDGVWSVEEL